MSTTPATHAGTALPAPTLPVVVPTAGRAATSGDRAERGRLRRLATRVSEAVRSAHSAAVPF